MTADYRVRLRRAAEADGGARLVVARDDLLLLLADTSGTAPVAEDPTPVIPAQRATEAVQPPTGRGSRVIALSTGAADIKRLAHAAWATSPERLDEHGGWWRAPLHLRREQLDAARRCLEWLADPPHDPPPA
jgi:hypothetical protein